MSIPDPGFELDDGSWSLNDRAEIQSVQVYEGMNALKLRTTSDFDGSNVKDGMATATMTSNIGTPVVVTGWVYADDALKDPTSEQTMRYGFSSDGDPGFFDVHGQFLKDDWVPGWNRFSLKEFTPTVTDPLIRFWTVISGALSTGIDAEWYVDSLSDDVLAIKLSERAIDAVVATLDANMATELTAIDTERGDGVTMTAPVTANYHTHPKAEIAGARAQVEVYEQAFDFNHPYTDHQTGRALYTVPLMIRLTWFNENAESVNTMYKRMRRYGSAITKIIVENPTLEANDDSIQVARIGSFRPHHEVEGEDSTKAAKCTVELPIEVDCEEIA